MFTKAVAKTVPKNEWGKDRRPLPFLVIVYLLFGTNGSFPQILLSLLGRVILIPH